jgi:hypothetical protein
MKYKDNRHKIAYREVFLYSRILSYIQGSEWHAEMSSPFTYKNGTEMSVYLQIEPAIGIGQRNFQRDELFANRGYLLLISGGEQAEKVVGYYSKVKKTFTLYPTERIEPREIKILNIIKNYLTDNNITVIIDIDEKKRYRHEIRRNRGNRVQYRDIEH